MAVFALTNVGILTDSLSIAGFATDVELSSMADEIDFTTFGSAGWRTKKPGLFTHSLVLKGFTDFSSTGTDVQFPPANVGTYDTFTIAPINGGTNVGDPTFIGQGLMNTNKPFGGAVGAPAVFEYNWSGFQQLVRGQMLHPVAARTATGNGTGATFTPPTSTQALYASFHVLSVTGSGTIQFTIQTATSGAFSSPTTRITSSSFTAVGSELDTVAGAITDTNLRVTWTITGFTSVTFACAAGVL